MEKTPERHELERRWRDLVGDGPGPASVRDDVLRRYGEPHRRYHTPTHLCAVLRAVDALASACVDVSAVRMAAWFHDAVYKGAAGTDEEESAQLALRLLPQVGVEPSRVDDVARLVRLTATHAPTSSDADGQVLCDADLSILGAAREEYRAYADAIRQEYAHVPTPLFREGRIRVLRTLGDRTPLFHTPLARKWWEESARRNIAAEITTLRAASAP
ncbi:metal-dependent phosphohydrolase [Spiractinospora alimapuensis]|nr:metal-dependent phosphohydrolase [Spiractinospora alimapuensis]